MHDSIRFFKTLGGIGAAGLLIGTEALADTYAGLNCVEAADTTPSIYYLDGKALNDNASTSNRFLCPIDVTFPESVDATIAVLDQSTTDDVSCFVRSCDMTATICTNSNVVATSFTGVDTLSPNTVGVILNGYAHVVCDVPAIDVDRSGVLSYFDI